MALTHWSPGRDILSIRDELNGFMNELLGKIASQEHTGVSEAWMPRVDTYETADTVVLKAELPGFSKDDISLEVRSNTLTLQGERQQEAVGDNASYHHRECTYGAFERSFLLPATVDQNGIRATYKDGVLEVRLPKEGGGSTAAYCDRRMNIDGRRLVP